MSGIPPIPPYPMPTTSELPENTAGWRLRPDRAALVIHDMQQYFVQPFPAGRQPVTDLVANTVRLRALARGLLIPVCYTAQPGSMSRTERGLLDSFWGPGMSVAAADRALIADLAPEPGDRTFTKWRYSAFHNSDLLGYLTAQGRDQIILCGVYAHLGVMITAVDAFSHDIQPFLVADAVADFSPADHRMALEYASRRCAVVATTEQLATALTPVSAR